MQMPGLPPESNTVVALSRACVNRPHPSSGVEQDVIELFEQLKEPVRCSLSGAFLSLYDSEDIIQETFLALFRHLRCGKSRKHLRGCLFQDAHYRALEKHQRAQRDCKNIRKSI